MNRLLFGLALLTAVGAGACGHEIGDSCQLSIDCSPNGDRICDLSSNGGYCTIFGCDYNTCPDEAVCVRFFTGFVANAPCDPDLEDVSEDNCRYDEICTLRGYCSPRASEVRYCMKECGDGGDCRSGYECRDRALMEAHGGEPVLSPGASGESLPGFCAEAE